MSFRSQIVLTVVRNTYNLTETHNLYGSPPVVHSYPQQARKYLLVTNETGTKYMGSGIFAMYWETFQKNFVAVPKKATESSERGITNDPHEI